MAGPATLYDYYTSQGQAMPTLDARGAAYEAAGLGKAADYIAQNKAGSALPNQTLLAYLTSGTKPGAVAPGSASLLPGATGGATGAVGTGTMAPQGSGQSGITWNSTTGSTTGSATGGSTGSTPNPITTPPYNEDPRMKAFIEAMSKAGLDMGTIANRMMGELGAASSTNEIDSFVTKTADYWEKYMQENRAAAEAQFGRESDYTLRKMEGEKTAAQEQGRGNAQQFYAYQLMDREIEKSVRDLESRKMQAISEGNAKAYEAMSNLQVKQIEYRQQAKQNYLSGLANVAGVYGKQQDIYKGVMDTIRGMTSDKLTYEMNMMRNKIDMAKNATDAANDALRIKIMEREVRVKEAAAGDAKRLAPTGWSDFNLYTAVSGNIMNQMSAALAKYPPESNPEEYFQELTSIFNKAKIAAGPNATPEGIANVMGLSLDSSGKPTQATAGSYVVTPTGSGKNQNSSFWDAVLSAGAGANMSFLTPGIPLLSGLMDLIINPNTGEATTKDGQAVVEVK